MKRLFGILLLILALLASFPAAAAEGKVTYSGDAGKFIFAPGSEQSPSDLFPDFKDVMPGDRLEQKITVTNKASNRVKVKIYLRSKGAQQDQSSREFLSQLRLTVKKTADTKNGYMFDAAADQKGGLADWTLLGTLYSGGKVDLALGLEVPTSLDQTQMNQIGYLDWEFKIEELPIEKDDPATGDRSNIYLWAGIALGSAAMILLLIFPLFRKKKKEDA